MSRFQPEDKLAIYTRDEQIETSFVQVKREDGSLGEEEMLRLILRRIDREKETVIQLSKPGERDVAVVQIAKISDLRERLRERERAEREKMLAERDNKPKQIELNWAISEHDLELKLKQMEQFVDEGRKVELLLAAKKRARKASQDEGNEVLKKIRERLVAIDAKEIAPMEGQVLRQAVMTVKTKKLSTERLSRLQDAELASTLEDQQNDGDIGTSRQSTRPVGGRNVPTTPAAQARFAARRAREEKEAARKARAEKRAQQKMSIQTNIQTEQRDAAKVD